MVDTTGDIVLSEDHLASTQRVVQNVLADVFNRFGLSFAAAHACAWIFGMTRWVANNVSPEVAIGFLDQARASVLELIEQEGKGETRQ